MEDNGERGSAPALSLGGDRPRECLADDRLGYGGFARALATSVLRMAPRDGMVMAVHGAWGSGKTSAVNMAIDALGQMQGSGERAVVVVRFEPWLFSGQEDLVRAFFAEVSASLGSRVSSRVVDGLRELARRVSGVRKVIGAGTGLMAGGALVGSLAEGALEGLGALADGGESLHQIRERLRAALREEDRRILVVIDDVDRLPDDEAKQIFRLVKTVADLPNVVHLLVFDREVARKALGPAATADGPEWLEKIVQVSYDLPIPHRVDLHRMFTLTLNEVVGPDAVVQPERWPDVFHRAVAPWLRTPRDVTRLVNAVAAAWPVVHDKVDLADHVAIEVLRLFEPRLYEVVRRSASELAGLGDARGDQRHFAQGLLEASAASRRDDARKALALLFPRLERTWSNRHYADGFMKRWDEARRVCSARRFTSYFTFTLDDDLLSASERDDIRRALVDVDTLTELVDTLSRRPRRAGGTRADLVLDEVAYGEDLVADELVEPAARALLAVGDRFMTEGDARTWTLLPMAWRVGYAAKVLLGRLEPGRRTAVLSRCIEVAPSVRTLSHVMENILAEHGVDGREPTEIPDARLVRDEDLAPLKGTFRARLAREASAGRLAGNPDLETLLHVWRRVGGGADARTWASEQMRTPHGLVALAVALTGIGVGGAIGSHARIEFPTVNRASLVKILDVDDLVARLQTLRAQGSSMDAGIADRFLQGLAREMPHISE